MACCKCFLIFPCGNEIPRFSFAQSGKELKIENGAKRRGNKKIALQSNPKGQGQTG
jgi:hypothetical protein